MLRKTFTYSEETDVSCQEKSIEESPKEIYVNRKLCGVFVTERYILWINAVTLERANICNTFFASYFNLKSILSLNSICIYIMLHLLRFKLLGCVNYQQLFNIVMQVSITYVCLIQYLQTIMLISFFTWMGTYQLIQRGEMNFVTNCTASIWN